MLKEPTLAGKMSIIERIREIQRTQAEQAAREKAEKEAVTENVRLVRERAEKPQGEAAEKRKLFVVQQTKKVITESGVLDCFTKIKDELLEEGEDKHPLTMHEWWGERLIPNTFFKKLEQNYEQGSLKLMWGSTLGISTGWGYYYILAEVNPDNETLTLGNKVFQKQEWANKELIEDAVGKTDLNPERKPSYEQGSRDGMSAPPTGGIN